MSGKITDLKVEQLVLGELDPEEARAVESALEAQGDPRLAAIQASNEEILEELPPSTVAAEVQRRSDQRQPSRSRTAWLAVPVMAAAAVVLWVATADHEPAGAPEGATPAIFRDDLVAANDTVRIKGSADPHLLLYRKRDTGEEKIEREQLVRAGDVLQISYVAAGRLRGVVFSIDGAGAVTLHHPNTLGEPTMLQESGETPLPHGYELDDAPDFERFFFVTPTDTGTKIDAAVVLEKARSLALDPKAARDRPLALPESLQQWSIVVRKGKP